MSLRRPGGVLVLVDIHPLVTMVDTVDPLVVDFPYGGEEQHRFTSAASYAASGLPAEAQETLQWPHGLGEVVTAAAAAGLVGEGRVTPQPNPTQAALSVVVTDSVGSTVDLTNRARARPIRWRRRGWDHRTSTDKE